ncbi:MAG: DUF1816 domain-containing protein [Leptolyngbyaceae cyanobacterium]
MWFSFFKLHAPWWVKVQTKVPQCVYFFGPFTSSQEAHHHKNGYIEDLTQEGGQGIRVAVRRGHPKVLTLAKEVDK